MKKFFVILILILCLSPGGVQAYEKYEARMLNDLIAYTYQSEKIFSDLKWALDYCDNFNKNKTWENLQIARAAVTTSKRFIEKYKMPKLEMTPDDYSKFMKRGLDFGIMTTLDKDFKAAQITLLNTCNALSAALITDIFLVNNWKVCEHKFAIERRLADLNIKYLANFANRVLNDLNDQEITKKFNNLLKDSCSETSSFQIKELREIKGLKQAEARDKLEASAQNILDQIHAKGMEENKILGTATDNLNATKYALDKKDFESMRKNIMHIANTPAKIIYKSWIDLKDAFYYWQEDGKIIQTPEPGTKLTRMPDGCRISINGVSAAQIKEYAQDLKKQGVPYLAMKEDGGKLKIYYILKGSSEFVISHENNQAEIWLTKNPVHFVPILYLSLMQK